MSDLKEVTSLIRSFLLTSKGGTTIDDLNRDYKSVENENIPFRRLGFPNLNDLLKQIPGLRTYRRGDSIIVEAIPTAETAHIASMVAKQKTSKAKRKRRPVEREAIKFRKPNISTRTDYSRTSQVSSSRNPPIYSHQRTNLKPSNPLPRNVQPSPPQQNRQTLHLPTTTNWSVTEQHKSTVQSNDNRSNRNATFAPLNLPSPPMNREVNGKSASYINPPLLHYSQPSQPLRISPSERLVKPLLPTPNLSRNVRENINTDRRINFTEPEVKKVSPRTPPIVAPLPIVTSTPPLSPNLKDPRDELLYLIRSLKLSEPEYKIFRHSKQNKINSVLCSVTVGTKKYSSYPAEAKTEDEAQKLAAVQAVLNIHKSHGPLVQLRVTSDVETIKQRIIAIVDIHNGVLIEQLPVYYKENHNETLPDNWIRIVEDCPKELTLEKNGINNSFILWRYNPAIHKVRESPTTELDKVPSFIGDAVPASIVYPAEDVWPVYIQNVINTSEIWAVILEDNYNSLLVAMTKEMAKSEFEPKQPAKSVDIGQFYVVKDEGTWYRVRVDNIDHVTNEADIFFIDTGDFDVLSCKQLYPLHKRFCDVPPQAIKLSLAGLEAFSNCDVASSLAEDLFLGQESYVSIESRNETDNEVSFSVTLYDTSGEEDVNGNDLLLQRLLKTNESPQLTIDGRIFDVSISNIEANGNVYIQLKTDGLKIIAALINRLISPSCDVEAFKEAAVHDNIDTTEIFLAKCPDGNWMRSKVIEILGGRRLKMLFIDFGRTIVVDTAKLLRLRPLSQILEEYPQQAFKVQLHNIEKSSFSEQMRNRLLELAPRNEQLLCKVIKGIDVPIVELFKRSQPDNVLISINNTLTLIPEIDRNIEDGNNNVKSKKRGDRLNFRCNSNDNDGGLKCLRRPPIPAVGEIFDVHVTSLAANPSNFIVQPYLDVPALKTMMAELRDSCNEYPLPMLTSDALREGKLCAAKYNDEWYRACINGIIDNQTVVVYLCDYGDMTPIGTDQLQPLKKEFTDLPYQGIKAQLFGIAPTNVDWTPHTCARFQNLVANKDFASIVHNIEQDKTSPTELILSLELIDVSTAVDIKIHEKLVQEDRAILSATA